MIVSFRNRLIGLGINMIAITLGLLAFWLVALLTEIPLDTLFA